MINTQASIYIRGIYRIAIPLQLDKSLDQMGPADFDTMQASIEASVSEIYYLLDLCHSLDAMYTRSA